MIFDGEYREDNQFEVKVKVQKSELQLCLCP